MSPDKIPGLGGPQGPEFRPQRQHQAPPTPAVPAAPTGASGAATPRIDADRGMHADHEALHDTAALIASGSKEFDYLMEEPMAPTSLPAAASGPAARALGTGKLVFGLEVQTDAAGLPAWGAQLGPPAAGP